MLGNASAGSAGSGSVSHCYCCGWSKNKLPAEFPRSSRAPLNSLRDSCGQSAGKVRCVSPHTPIGEEDPFEGVSSHLSKRAAVRSAKASEAGFALQSRFHRETVSQKHSA